MALALLYGEGLYKGEVGGSLESQIKGPLDKCYWFAMEPGQGLAWAEFTSTPFPAAGINGVVIFDSKNQEHELIFDNATGTYFDVSLRAGPSSSGLTRGFKEKEDFPASHDTGDSIPCTIHDAEYVGRSEFNLKEYQQFQMAMRPDDDDDDYETGIDIDISLYDGDDEKISSIASSVDKTSEITLSPKGEASRLQPRIDISESGWRILGFEHTMLEKQQAAAPDINITLERATQKIFNSPDLWLFGNKNYLVDRAVGDKFTETGTVVRTTDKLSKGNALLYSAGAYHSKTIAFASGYTIAHTYMAWVKNTASGDNRYLLQVPGKLNGGASFGFDLLTIAVWQQSTSLAKVTAGYLSGLVTGGGSKTTDSIPWAVNEYHLVTVVFDGSAGYLYIYIDAALNTSRTIPSSSGTTVNDGTSHINGSAIIATGSSAIFDNRLYKSTAMTAAQIAWYYNECNIRSGKAAIPLV